MKRNTLKPLDAQTPEAKTPAAKSAYLSYSELPGWRKDNKNILSGYRPEMRDFVKCAKSIFGLHTETGNIWTHLVGFLMFSWLAIVFYARPFCDICDSTVEGREKMVFLSFFMGIMICLGLSTTYHTVSCHSHHVSKYFKKLDYTGIIVLIVGSFIPYLYYGFYCQPLIRRVYLAIIIVLGLCTVCVIMLDRFGTTEYRKVRALLFVLLGGFGFVPGYHMVQLNGLQNSVSNLHIDALLAMGLIYIFGAFLYGLRIPERFFPGKCDLWFQSHQIFHTLVLIAAFIHYRAVTNIALYRLSQTGQC